MNIEDSFKILKTIEDFKNGMAKISDVINAINVDLLDSDIEDLEKIIKEYKAEQKKQQDNQKIQDAITYCEIAFRDSEQCEEEPITRKDLENIYDILTKKEEI